MNNKAMGAIDLDHLSVWMSGSPGAILARFLSEYPSLYYILQRTHGIESQVGQHQACGLYLLANQFNRNGCRILNVGAAFGYSTAILAEAAPRAEIVSLDVAPKRIAISRRNLARYGNVKVVKMRSWDYLEAHPDQQWDMIFIDGCHRAIWNDMPFFNTIRPGGLFMSHDYIPDRFPFVVEALDSLRIQFNRAFDVSIIDDRNCGVVGMARHASEMWYMPEDYQWTEKAISGFKAGL